MRRLPRTALPAGERALRSRLHQVLHERDVLVGSLVRMRRTCGRAGCHCAQGARHASWYLSVRVRGRPRMVYIPAAWEARVRTWVARGRTLRQGLRQLSAWTLARLERREEP